MIVQSSKIVPLWCFPKRLEDDTPCRAEPFQIPGRIRGTCGGQDHRLRAVAIGLAQSFLLILPVQFSCRLPVDINLPDLRGIQNLPKIVGHCIPDTRIR